MSLRHGLILLGLVAAVTVACGSGDDPGTGEPAPVPPATTTGTFAIGGTVSGLTGTGLVLQLEGGDALPVAKAGAFTFTTQLAAGAAYKVTVKTQPSAPAQTCTVSGGTGTVAQGNVTSVTVNCESNKFTVGGSTTGLVGKGLVLQNKAGDDLTLNANGTFAFGTPVADGGDYAVTVKTQPATPSQTCTVTKGTGKVASANVTDVGVACTTNSYKVSATVTGLTGSGLVLKNNGGDNLTVAANGKVTFATSIASGANYAVTVGTDPENPAQTCTVTGGTGTVVASDVTSVAVNCSTKKFTVGGTASGVAANAVLSLNGAQDVVVSANGAFAFGTPLESGTAYTVTVKTQPTNPWQTCVLANESGSISAANVTNLTLTCTTNSYKLGGNVTGLTGSGLVLQNNAGNDLAVPAAGAFEFPAPILSGANYAVTVKTQPTNPSQTCVVAQGSGKMAGANVGNVAITCTTDSFTVGGAVTGLAGAGLVLQDNGGDDLAVAANGNFVFPTKVLSGANYAVTVKTQPANPTQTCTVSAGSGTVTNGNVATVAINCATNKYTVGGTVTGLAGTGLQLRNNGGDTLSVNQNGAFSFATSISSGQNYAVTVFAQPTNPWQTCQVTSGSGTVTNANITTVAVTCTTNKYTVGGTLSGLSGSPVTLRNNGGADLVLNANGAFTFPAGVDSGAGYSVTVQTQPADRFCVASSATGTIAGANVTNVSVTCTLYQTFTAGGVTFYKVPVAGTLTDDNIRAACQAAGFTVPCQAQAGCTYNDGLCKLNALENSCGNPMLRLSQAICGGQSPSQCASLYGVYQYMGNNWLGGCGAEAGQWCTIGNNVGNKSTLCVAP